MSKFHGKVGYVRTVETEPSVYQEVVTEYEYYGDVLRDTLQWQKSGNLNDNLTISNRFSLVGDWFSYENFAMMRYITYIGYKWKIINVEIQRPRLIVTAGGVYNG